MNADRRQRRERKRQFPPCAERGRCRIHDQRGRDDEAEPVGGRHVEQQQRRRKQGAQSIKLAGRRGGLAAFDRNDLFLLLKGVADAECDREPAQRKPASDYEREYVGTDRLPGYRRQQPAAIGGRSAKANQKQSRDAIGKTHVIPPRSSTGHGRARPGHPRLAGARLNKTWMPATNVSMTKEKSLAAI